MYRLLRGVSLFLWGLIKTSFSFGVGVARVIALEVFRGLITYLVVLKVLNRETQL